MKINRVGFSLIELLVVVAIIGVLAIIAVPSYKSYINSARLMEAANIVSKIVDDAIHRNETTTCGFPASYLNGFPCEGAAPNPLGFGDGGGGFVDDTLAAEAIPYFLPTSQGGGMLFGNYSSCGAYYFGAVVVALDPNALGFDSAVANNNYTNWSGMTGIVLSCYYWVTNGQNYKYCDYIYGTENGSGVDNILPGWENANTTINNDYANEMNAVVNNSQIPGNAGGPCP